MNTIILPTVFENIIIITIIIYCGKKAGGGGLKKCLDCLTVQCTLAQFSSDTLTLFKNFFCLSAAFFSVALQKAQR